MTLYFSKKIDLVQFHSSDSHLRRPDRRRPECSFRYRDIFLRRARCLRRLLLGCIPDTFRYSRNRAHRLRRARENAQSAGSIRMRKRNCPSDNPLHPAVPAAVTGSSMIRRISFIKSFDRQLHIFRRCSDEGNKPAGIRSGRHRDAGKGRVGQSQFIAQAAAEFAR